MICNFIFIDLLRQRTPHERPRSHVSRRDLLHTGTGKGLFGSRYTHCAPDSHVRGNRGRYIDVLDGTGSKLYMHIYNVNVNLILVARIYSGGY